MTEAATIAKARKPTRTGWSGFSRLRIQVAHIIKLPPLQGEENAGDSAKTYVRWWSAIVERWANEWMIAPLGNELVRSARPHQGAHDPVRGQSTQSVEKV